MLTLDIDRRYQLDSIPKDKYLNQWGNIAYQGDTAAEAALVIVDEASMQTFNRDFRQMDKPTNVLSFPANLPEIDGTTLLGDIIVCATIVNREAQQQNKSQDAHWAHMMIHGILHLQNYDHVNDDDAQRMEALEIALLNKLNFPNPYLLNSSM